MELRDYVVLLRRRGWMIVFALALGLLGAHLATGAVTPRYEASTAVFVGGSGKPDPSGIPTVESGPALQSLARSYTEFARSGSVRRDAEQRLGRRIDPESITASAVPETQILRISSSAADSRRAAEQTNALARSLMETVESQPGRRQARLSVVDEARPPAEAVSPKPALNLALGGLLGLLIGFAAALGAERLDNRVRQGRDPSAPSPLPVLGRLPKLPRRVRALGAQARHCDPRVAEPYRRLAAAVEHRCRSRQAKLLVTTSPVRGDGKTTIAAHLALTLAEEGRRVALVECDLRRPDLGRHFELDGRPGLCEALLSGARPEPVQVRPGLEVYPAGASDLEGARRLVSSSRLSSFLGDLRERCDYVIVDTPPVLALADAGLLAQRADCALLIMREGATSLDELTEAWAALTDLDAEVLGSVLNEAPEPGGSYGYYSSSGSGYPRAPHAPRRRQRRPGSLRNLSRSTKLALAASVVLVLAVTVTAGFALASGARALSEGLAALNAGRFGLAGELCAGAEGKLGLAGALLSPFATALGWLGPVGESLRSADNVADAGHDLAGGAHSLAAAGALAEDRGLTGAAAPMLDDAAKRFSDAARTAQTAASASQIVPALGAAERDMEDRAMPLARRTWAAAALAGLAEKEGRYLFVVQNNAELRATGGLVGAFGTVDATGGRLRLAGLRSDRALGRESAEVRAPADFTARYGRFGARRTWANANMSPDFATSAKVLLALHERDTGTRLDGVVAIDAVGLSLLLEAVGPTEADGLRLEGATFVRQALSEAYRRPEAERTRVLLAGARAGWENLGEGRNLPALARALGDSAGQGHLRAFARDPGLQDEMERGALDGSVVRPAGDYLMVVRQNAGANKLDYHLSSTMRYDVRLAKDGSARAQLTVAVKNSAPGAGLPDYVLGRRLPGDPPGLARTWMSAYSPAGADMLAFAGPEGPTAESGKELGHSVRSWFHGAAPGGVTTASLRLRLPEVVDEDGNYHLTVQRQPVLGTTRLVVRLNGRPLYDGALRQDLQLAAPARVST